MSQNAKKQRLFIAVDFPKQVYHEIEKIKEELGKQRFFIGKYVRSDQVHITLKFIGEVSQQDAQQIEIALRTIKMQKMEARLGGLDLFMMGNRIKIIYLTIICPQLIYLAKEIEGQLLPWCEKERRDFVSHVTLARVKTVKDRDGLCNFIRSFPVESIPFLIDKFVLKDSLLLPEGPEYRDVALYELRD